MLTLIGRRVHLRSVGPGDAAWLARAMARGSWWRLESPWEGKPSGAELRAVPAQVRALARERVSPPTRMVIETRAAVPIGTVTRYWADERAGWLEVGIGIYDARHWGKGYGTEALAMWVDYLFETMNLRRVGLRTWSGNRRMMRLAHRLGFRREATFREACLVGGRAYDRVAYGLLRREWRRGRRP
ncbi:MAG: GNAT family N-acetyltransferase [Armatimonadota bacterium]|nr:GNAT family N-acetyltransferase [Armatimonadota bacterium]